MPKLTDRQEVLRGRLRLALREQNMPQELRQIAMQLLELNPPEMAALIELMTAKGRRGRPTGKKWDEARYIRVGQLYDDFTLYQKRMSDTKVAKLIFEKHKKLHSPEVIRQRLPEARRRWALWQEFLFDFVPDPAAPESDSDPEDWPDPDDLPGDL